MSNWSYSYLHTHWCAGAVFYSKEPIIKYSGICELVVKMLVTWNWLQWGYLHHGTDKCYKPGPSFSQTASLPAHHCAYPTSPPTLMLAMMFSEQLQETGRRNGASEHTDQKVKRIQKSAQELREEDFLQSGCSLLQGSLWRWELK